MKLAIDETSTMYQLRALMLAQGTGLVLAVVFYIFDTWLIKKIGVPAWENSLNVTLLYGFIVATIVTAALYPKRYADGVASYLVPIISVVGCASLAAITQIGFVSGLAFSVFSLLAIRFLRGVLYGWDFRSALTVLETIVCPVVLTVITGCVWIFQTAPVYAEGFVLLNWLLLGLYNALLFGGLFVVIGAKRLANYGLSRMRLLKTVPILLAVIVSSGLGVFYLMWAEGEIANPLEEPEEWSAGFRPLRPSDPPKSVPLVQPKFVKADVVAMLRAQGDLSDSQMATLFLLTGDEDVGRRFKRRILDAARRKDYVGGEGSIKYGQRHAMHWALYYRESRLRAPELFTELEQQLVETWFGEIIQNIMRPGWVDYLYAIPFRSWPYGPYLNQEIGAGAVAALRRYVPKGNPELKDRISEFIAAQYSGWTKTFRNQDDAYGYHTVWMGSVLGTWLNTRPDDSGPAPPGLRYSVEWLKLQIPLAAFPINYGLPEDFRPIDGLAIGAFVLRDPESRWLLDQQLAEVKRSGADLPRELTALYLWDDAVPLKPYRPVSQLLFAPTGYTFRPGKLGPDKIVLRSSLEPEHSEREVYALINLRSSGWHRYPATNTIIRLAYGNVPVLVEALVARNHNWLPKGRARHRDKKVDRSRLNGLVVERTGLDAFVGGLAGVYSRWRQDVPRFALPTLNAKVGNFQAVEVETRGWDGVIQKRAYIMDDRALFSVFDRVKDTGNRAKAVNWYLSDYFIDTVEKSNASAGNTTIDYHFLGSSKTRISETMLDDWLPHAYNDAPPGIRVVLTSNDQDFFSAAFFSFQHRLRDVQHRRLSSNGRNGIDIVSYRTDLGRNEIIFGEGNTWEHRQIKSDARIARFLVSARALEVTLIEASYIELGKEAVFVSANWYQEGGTGIIDVVKLPNSKLRLSGRSGGELRLVLNN